MARLCCVGWPHSPVTPGNKVLEDATRDGSCPSVPHWCLHWCPMPELVMRKTSPFPAWGTSNIPMWWWYGLHTIWDLWAGDHLVAQMVTGVC